MRRKIQKFALKNELNSKAYVYTYAKTLICIVTLYVFLFTGFADNSSWMAETQEILQEKPPYKLGVT